MTELEHLLLAALERLANEAAKRDANATRQLTELAEQLASGEKELGNLAALLTGLAAQVNHLTEQLGRLEASLAKLSNGSKNGR